MSSEEWKKPKKTWVKGKSRKDGEWGGTVAVNPPWEEEEKDIEERSVVTGKKGSSSKEV